MQFQGEHSGHAQDGWNRIRGGIDDQSHAETLHHACTGRFREGTHLCQVAVRKEGDGQSAFRPLSNLLSIHVHARQVLRGEWLIPSRNFKAHRVSRMIEADPADKITECSNIVRL